jgi:methylglutaconyl-CoA hydratase
MSDENSAVLLQDVQGGVATLTLHRPKRLNALDGELLESLVTAISEAERDIRVRVVVLTGAGQKAFCVGADLKERQTMSSEDVEERIRTYRRCFDALAGLSKPTICAINGFAFGGGLEIALATDIRLATADATMGLTELRLGIIPGAGGTQRLTRLVGPSRAKELIFSAARIGAQEAARFGIINKVAEGDLLQETQALAESICRSAPIALAQAKRAIDQGVEMNLSAGLDWEAECYQVTIPTEDRLEGLEAFSQRRPPIWRGR